MKTRTVLVSLSIGVLVIAAGVMFYRASHQAEVAPDAPPAAELDDAGKKARLEQLAQIAKTPEAGQDANPAQIPGAAAALAKGLDSGAQAFKALSQDQNKVKAGQLTELQLDERSRTVHAPRFKLVMQDLAKAKFPPGDPRAAFAQDYTQLVALVLEGLKMESTVVDGKPLPLDPARIAAIEAEIQQLNARIPKEMEELKTLQAMGGLR